ncbi:hypothetical protein GGI35DRAFT_440710 [Trichoderma velutinum]
MSELTTSFAKLKLGRGVPIGFGDEDEVPSGNLATPSHDTPRCPDEVPFCPLSNLATKLHDTPRYLFRVFSDASAGENSSEWVKSVDALDNNFENIFARNAFTVAITLNEHLMWEPKSCGDPFISWTTSLLVAIQYAIYKHKTEYVKLSTIRLCIVDTTLFPNGVFMKDLDLIEAFQDKVPNDYPIIFKGEQYLWKARGLENVRQLRNRQHKNYYGVYYYGEYLSQGQTKINGRSCVVPCNKIINKHLFAFMPQLKLELEDESPYWANSVNKFRKPFYVMKKEATNNFEFVEAMAIALEFDRGWRLPMLANLLALSPRWARDPANLVLISDLFPDEVKDNLSTNVVANENIPEVLQFGKIIHDINIAYYAKSFNVLVKSMEKTADIFHHFIRDSKTTGGQRMLDTGNLAGYLSIIDHDHVQPLIQSLETLSETIIQLQEGKT